MIYELSDAAAALATFKGNLDLNELKKLSDAAANHSPTRVTLISKAWPNSQMPPPNHSPNIRVI